MPRGSMQELWKRVLNPHDAVLDTVHGLFDT